MANQCISEAGREITRHHVCPPGGPESDLLVGVHLHNVVSTGLLKAHAVTLCGQRWVVYLKLIY